MTHTRDDAEQMAGDTGTFWFDQGKKAAEANLREASTLAAALDMLEALTFYANPQTYFAIAVLADAPCGDFAFDTAPLTDDLVFEDYREKGTSYYGKRAREALMTWRKVQR